MANKQKKRRNKQYSGWEAAQETPTVHRIKAVKRSKVGQWRHENRRAIKIWLIGTAIISVLALIIVGLVGLFT